jgi:hypothetical protein
MGRPDDDDLMPMSDRLVTAGEMAQIMGVAEADVREWMADGRLPSEAGEDGSPRVRITEGHRGAGPLEEWMMSYRTGGGPDFVEEQARRQRAHQRSQGDPGGVDVGLLTKAVAARLRQVAPHRAMVTIEDVGFIRIGDRPGTGAGIGLTPANLDESRTDAERVLGVVGSALASAQDEFAEISTDPWPVFGPGSLPDPHAELSDDQTVIRLWFGDADRPVLELEPLLIADVLLGAAGEDARPRKGKAKKGKGKGARRRGRP